jgi:hypothetical protein
MTGALPVSTTGEFQAVTPNATPSTPPHGVSATTTLTCCWCNKPKDEVKKLLSQNTYHICNECVALCADIMRMELGDDFG